MTLVLLPAVDVADGAAVRLVQGAAGTETSYGEPLEAALAWQRGGAEWIHLVDLDAAWELVQEFDQPAVAIIKHSNPAGVAIASSVAEAYQKALATDPVSAFGSVIGVNREVDEALAEEMIEEHGGPVGGDFYYVFGGVGVGFLEVCDYGFVECFSCGVKDFGEAGLRGGKRVA